MPLPLPFLTLTAQSAHAGDIRYKPGSKKRKPQESPDAASSWLLYRCHLPQPPLSNTKKKKKRKEKKRTNSPQSHTRYRNETGLLVSPLDPPIIRILRPQLPRQDALLFARIPHRRLPHLCFSDVRLTNLRVPQRLLSHIALRRPRRRRRPARIEGARGRVAPRGNRRSCGVSGLLRRPRRARVTHIWLARYRRCCGGHRFASSRVLRRHRRETRPAQGAVLLVMDHSSRGALSVVAAVDRRATGLAQVERVRRLGGRR